MVNWLVFEMFTQPNNSTYTTQIPHPCKLFCLLSAWFKYGLEVTTGLNLAKILPFITIYDCFTKFSFSPLKFPKKTIFSNPPNCRFSPFEIMNVLIATHLTAFSKCAVLSWSLNWV